MDSFILYSADNAIKTEISRLSADKSLYHSTDNISDLQYKIKSANAPFLVIDLQSFTTKKKSDDFFKKLSLTQESTLITISGGGPGELTFPDFPCMVIHVKREDLANIKILLKYLIPAFPNSFSFNHNFIIKSELMQSLINDIELIVNSDVHIFLTGETGTGKTELARYIHYNSKRKRAPLMHINCAAIPETLLEAELFGYKKGAFTGAENDVIGKFRAAGAGTILLDEIGEISHFLQAKLLKVLDEKEYYPLGGTKVEKVKARIIAATNTDIATAVREKKFRQDLYYRLNTIEVDLPPLRKRQEAIPVLFNHFVQEFSKINKISTPKINNLVYDVLANYTWPGNIRELQNLAELIIHKNPGLIDIDSLPEHIRANPRNIIIRDAEKYLTLDIVKKKYAKYIYKLCDYKKGKTASVLRVDIKTVRKLLS